MLSHSTTSLKLKLKAVNVLNFNKLKLQFSSTAFNVFKIKGLKDSTLNHREITFLCPHSPLLHSTCIIWEKMTSAFVKYVWIGRNSANLCTPSDHIQMALLFTFVVFSGSLYTMTLQGLRALNNSLPCKHQRWLDYWLGWSAFCRFFSFLFPLAFIIVSECNV